MRPADLNVLLVTLDTTRADRLGAYGFKAIETPTLDRIAREGVLFEHAVAPAPLTLPAHSSLFTSKLPPAHGVRDNGGFFLDDRETTMAERLKSRRVPDGRLRRRVRAGPQVGDRAGVRALLRRLRSLEVSQRRRSSSVERRGDEVADHALEWLEHGDVVAILRVGPLLRRALALRSARALQVALCRPARTPARSPLSTRRSAACWRWLDSISCSTKTIVVVMGDHGESLGDHGEGTHGFFVYDSVLHVPLLIRAPYDAMRGRRVADVVRSVDVQPTLLDLLGIRSTDTFEGQSLTSLMTGARSELGLEAYAEAVYPRFHFGWSDLRTLRAGRYKYIEAPRPELYDLDTDPRETTNILPQRRALAGQMRAHLRALEARLTAGAATLARRRRSIRTRAIGWRRSATSARSSPATRRRRIGLADPKDKIELFNLITRARDLSRHDKDSDEAITSLLEVTRQDPKVIDAWFMLGNEYYRKRQFEQAIESYKRALALKSDYDLVVINMANAYRQLGKDEEALVGYRRFMELDPRNAQIRYEAAQVLIDRGDLAERARSSRKR